MKAVICETPGRLAMIDRPRPEPAPGEVLVHIRRIGVCGTDFHIFGGKHPFLEYPRVMGHELSGEVVTAPAGSDLAAGDQVFVMPYLSCGECVACRKGKTNCCTLRRGVTRGRPKANSMRPISPSSTLPVVTASPSLSGVAKPTTFTHG